LGCLAPNSNAGGVWLWTCFFSPFGATFYYRLKVVAPTLFKNPFQITVYQGFKRGAEKCFLVVPTSG
jgi:hypothetical protein